MQNLQTAIYIALALNFIIGFFFCLAIRNALLQVQEENRALPMATVWLLLIPVFSLIWIFIVVQRVSQSIEAELHERNFEVDEKPAYIIGMSYAVTSLIMIFPFPALLQFVFGIAGLIFFIQYWLKINWYKRILKDDADQEKTEEL
ncbi:hypothetical protein GS399_02400 [Pedobacter sp. HMF7647]|uniref:Uncharacterized protein n=1 Tax=Hufsiella arboris TaxID=2695275 RepID=A0A7K1Y5E3_9SPHI|nr:hypothetical protein [Hufsiella arboris]MXV49805.1 hypothetical protein [Hufsiella arboris]